MSYPPADRGPVAPPAGQPASAPTARLAGRVDREPFPRSGCRVVPAGRSAHVSRSFTPPSLSLAWREGQDTSVQALARTGTSFAYQRGPVWFG